MDQTSESALRQATELECPFIRLVFNNQVERQSGSLKRLVLGMFLKIVIDPNDCLVCDMVLYVGAGEDSRVGRPHSLH